MQPCIDHFTAKIETLLNGMLKAQRTVVATGSGLFVRTVGSEGPGPDEQAAQHELQRLWDAYPDAVWRIVTEYNRAAPKAKPPA